MTVKKCQLDFNTDSDRQCDFCSTVHRDDADDNEDDRKCPVCFTFAGEGSEDASSSGDDDASKDMVEEMNIADAKPNQVTISILLRNLNSSSGNADILRTMDLIKTMDEDMDEVLLSLVVEACVRIGKPDVLESQLKQLEDPTPIVISGSHTYGSLVEIYGHAKDIAGIWRCWKEMRGRHIKPTSITLGCMVEVTMNNGETEGAFHPPDTG